MELCKRALTRGVNMDRSPVVRLFMTSVHILLRREGSGGEGRGGGGEVIIIMQMTYIKQEHVYN